MSIRFDIMMGVLLSCGALCGADDSAKSVAISCDAGEAFEKGMGAWDVRWDAGKSGVALNDRVLIEDDGPGARAYNLNTWFKMPLSPTTVLDGEVCIKKVLRVDRLPALSAKIYLYGPAKGAQITVNGKPLDGAAVPPELLKIGDNEIVLSMGKNKPAVLMSSSEDILANEPERKAVPPRSFKSADGGKTWEPVSGEYRVRLYINQYCAEGSFVSQTLYLGSPEGKTNGLVDTLTVREISLKAQAEVPKDTAITYFIRTGASPVYSQSAWSDWRAAAEPMSAPSQHVYTQWKAVLSSSAPLATPVLNKVTLNVNAVKEPPPSWSAAVTLESLNNKEIRYTSMPFTYENADHSKLVALREKYKLDDVVKGAKSQFEAQVMLRDWVRRQWKYKPPTERFPSWDADEIIQGKTGFCVQYAITYVQCCLALGYEARFFFGYHPGGPGSGHEVADVWSDDYQKWVLMDAEVSRHHVDAATKIPLSMTEIQTRMIKAMYGDREISPGNIARTPTDSPDMETCKGLDLVPKPRDPAASLKSWPPWYKWLQVRYVPRNDWYSHPHPLPYQQGYCWDWTGYWVWEPPRVPRLYQYAHYTSRNSDLNWTINQVCFDAAYAKEPGSVRLQMGTVTPNFKTFIVNVDGQGWKESGETFSWTLHKGSNHLKMRVRNKAGVEGAVSELKLVWND